MDVQQDGQFFKYYAMFMYIYMYIFLKNHLPLVKTYIHNMVMNYPHSYCATRTIHSRHQPTHTLLRNTLLTQWLRERKGETLVHCCHLVAESIHNNIQAGPLAFSLRDLQKENPVKGYILSFLCTEDF